jgi:chemotaxis protein histidine kinase CheA
MSHVKAIAKVLIQLADSGTEDAIEPLGRAYREAHGLKGSATTVGMNRVALLAEKMELALRHITQDQRRLSYEDVDMLLGALDAIRKALAETDGGEDDAEKIGEDAATLGGDAEELNDDEKQIVEKLLDFIQKGGEKVTPRTEPQKEDPKESSRNADATADAAPAKEASKTPESPEVDTSGDREVARRVSVEPVASGAGHRPTGREIDFPADQIMYLVSVFQAEAAEHIKSLAETLFNLEEGSADPGPLLVSAFREAHSLKGSAGTIGFDRVATVTHGLEDALGALQKNPKKSSAEIVDVLLDALDVIRRSVKEAELGDGTLSGKETKILAALRGLVERLNAEQADSGTRYVSEQAPPEFERRASRYPAPPRRTSIPPKRTSARPAAKSSSPPGASERTNVPIQSRDEFIRVSEDSIENLIAQIGELFEAHLHLMSVTSDLHRLDARTEEMARLVGEFVSDPAGGLSGETILERSKGLKTQIAALTKRFSRDEREFSKLIQNSQ